MATSKDKGDKRKTEAKKAGKAASAEPSDSFGDNIRAGDAAAKTVVRAGLVGGAGLAVSVVLGMTQNDSFRRFSYSYLTAYMWVLAIGLGALFWVTLQNLVNAKWSVALRRVGEILAATMPVIALLSLPVVVPAFLGHDTLYIWADHAKAQSDHLLHHKAPYLNSGFFLVRCVFYFGFWILLSRYFLKQSLAQDKSGDVDIGDRMQKVAGPGMIAFGLSLTFCVIDLVMSLDPYWFSTMFGVYYFASCVLMIHAVLVLTLFWLQGRGVLTKSFTTEHLHDLGKMMFAFTVFWAYIGFSQYMLIWYANVPEETAWFKERFEGGWADLSWALVFLHFIIPFFGMLSRHVKRSRKAMAFWAFWVLVEVYMDMYWLVMPSMKTEGEVPLALIDVTCLVGLAGVLFAAFAHFAKGINLVPVKDPRLPRSLAFENI